MSTTTITRTIGSALLTTQQITSNTIVAGGVFSLNGAIGARINVRYARCVAGSHGATVFRLEAGDSSGSVWTPVYTWTTGLHGLAAVLQSLQSNAAAGATTVQTSISLNAALSSPIAIVNTGDYSKTEWNYQLRGSTNAPLLNSLVNAQTAQTAQMTSYAEMWSIPIDTTGISTVRLVVDNIWNAVASPVVASASISLDTAATTTA